MEHVRKQGVTNVREVEDVLLAHLGLVPTLERTGRPASARDLDERLCARLKIDNVAELSDWLAAQHATVERQLQLLAWQSWGTDNQIIASVQTLLDQGAAAMGRSWPLEWKESVVADDERSSAKGLKKRVEVFRRRMSKSGQAPREDGGHLLIVCDREESGGHLRLLQQQFGQLLRCEVLIGNDQVDTWRNEVEGATRGVVLLQTKSVLRNPVRLLQLFECAHQRIPLVCVNVVGAGYDFATVKPLLRSLPTELSQVEVATLRTELAVHNQGVGQLSSSLSHAVPNAISVFFNPGAGDAMINASIKDVIDKLARDKKLLEAKAIGDVTADATAKRRALKSAGRAAVVATGVSTAAGEASRVAADADTAYDAQRTFVRAAEADTRKERHMDKAKGEQVTGSTTREAAGSSSMHASASAGVELAGSSSMHASAAETEHV